MPLMPLSFRIASYNRAMGRFPRKFEVFPLEFSWNSIKRQLRRGKEMLRLVLSGEEECPEESMALLKESLQLVMEFLRFIQDKILETDALPGDYREDNLYGDEIEKGAKDSTSCLTRQIFHDSAVTIQCCWIRYRRSKKRI